MLALLDLVLDSGVVGGEEMLHGGEVAGVDVAVLSEDFALVDSLIGLVGLA